MKREKLALVLGGGGARGAFQVGALQALLEARVRPDFVVGTSIGAVNAAFLAVHGFDQQALDELEAAWHEAEKADLLPDNYLWLTVRALFERGGGRLEGRLQQFMCDHGLSADLRFRDLRGIPAYLVTSDLNAGCPLLYGEDPDANVLEGVLASAALPPWVHPLNEKGHLLVDGGAVSNLPVEAAVSLGAGRIIALDLAEPRGTFGDAPLFGEWINKMMYTIQQRQQELELALAAALGIPTHVVHFQASEPVAVWDFSQTDELIALGYDQMRAEITSWPHEIVPSLQTLRERLAHLAVWTGRRLLSEN
jgi:NTE family protein